MIVISLKINAQIMHGKHFFLCVSFLLDWSLNSQSRSLWLNAIFDISSKFGTESLVFRHKTNGKIVLLEGYNGIEFDMFV